jgi:hypothetical protein
MLLIFLTLVIVSDGCLGIREAPGNLFTFIYNIFYFEKTTECTEDTEKIGIALCSLCPLWLIYPVDPV